MRFTVVERAPLGGTFAADAFAAEVGQGITVNLSGHVDPATLVAAEVAQDGGAVTLTLDVADGSLTAAFVLGGYTPGVTREVYLPPAQPGDVRALPA